MRRKLLFLIAGLLFIVTTAFAQSEIKGRVIDKDTQEPLVGVTLYSVTSKKSTTTDLSGEFTLKLPSLSEEIDFTYIGFKSIRLQANQAQGTIELETSVVGLKDVVVTSTIGVDRKTPIAMSTIDAEIIALEIGSKEFPEMLKSTPGVYATKEGGGFGDARVKIRGFEAENVAVMVNGVPINDMEWGGVYWSNWSGLVDVTRTMQVQRGLGASKVASPSVGGSINIVTKSTDAEKGGDIYYRMGSYGNNKLMFNVSTGLMNNNWAVTLLGAKEWGEGNFQAANFESYNYFLNISKLINDNHQLSLTATGAYQWHNQRKDQLLISEWAMIPEKDRYRYNPGYGYDAAGNHRTFNHNEYHKPHISLNHIWDINRASSLSTAVYVSLGTGGGWSGVGEKRSQYYGSTNGLVNQFYRRNDGVMGYRASDGVMASYGTYDFETLMNENSTSPNGSVLAIQNAINSHFWTGVLSTYSNKLSDAFEMQVGLDYRYYKGIHKTKIQDLLGGAYLVDPQRAIDGKFKNNPEWTKEKLKVGDVIYRNYNGYVMQEGLFGQLEYTQDKLSAFVSASANLTNYWRLEKYSADNEKSKTVNKFGYAVKGGVNYNLTEHHNVFANIGYFSRTPFYSSGVFLQAQRSNDINNEGVNEKVFSFEVGYGFRSKYMNANLNLYRTAWNDKTMVKLVDSNNPEKGYMNMTGVNAIHQGVELDIKAKPIKDLELTAMLSLGDWKWDGKPSGYAYDQDGNAVTTRGAITTPGAEDHAFSSIVLDGIRVGNSAQTTMAFGAKYYFLNSFRVGINYNFYGRNYAKYQMNADKWGENIITQPWKIPNTNTFDLYANYKFNIGGLKANLTGNIDNLLDAVSIYDASDGGNGSWETAKVYYSVGRTWRLGLKVSF